MADDTAREALGDTPITESILILFVRDKKLLRSVKVALEEYSLLDRTRKIQKDGTVFTTLTVDRNISDNDDSHSLLTLPQLKDTVIPQIVNGNPDLVLVATRQVPREAKQQSGTVIERFFKQYTNELNLSTTQYTQLVSQLPKKWSVYPPMVLFGNNTFDHAIWNDQFFSKYHIHRASFFQQLVQFCFPRQQSDTDHDVIDRLAINKPIPLADSTSAENTKRIPHNILPLHGDFGPEPTAQSTETPTEHDLRLAFWCHAKQNGIYQYWAPRYIMFSRGNVKEKLRVAETFENVRGNDVVDLYAGIGYFTLCYAARRCRRVYCWELNPWSVEGLVRGCERNGLRYQVTRHREPWNYSPDAQVYIFNESNECASQRFNELRENQGDKAALRLAHINLGLLPSSKPSWKISAELIRNFREREVYNKGTMVHVHENVLVSEFDSFVESTRDELGKLLAVRSEEPDQEYPVEFEHLEKIKTYAPDVWHICVDYKVC